MTMWVSAVVSSSRPTTALPPASTDRGKLLRWNLECARPEPRLDDQFKSRLTPTGAVVIFSLGNSEPQSLAGPVDIARMTAASHGYLGVELESAAPGGVGISRVFPGTGAERSGMQPGDVLLTVEGHAVSSVEDVQQRVAGKKAGEVVEVTLRRGSEERQLVVPLISLREMNAARAHE